MKPTSPQETQQKTIEIFQIMVKIFKVLKPWSLSKVSKVRKTLSSLMVRKQMTSFLPRMMRLEVFRWIILSMLVRPQMFQMRVHLVQKDILVEVKVHTWTEQNLKISTIGDCQHIPRKSRILTQSSDTTQRLIPNKTTNKFTTIQNQRISRHGTTGQDQVNMKELI